MYSSAKSQPVEFYLEESDMIIDSDNNGGLLTPNHQHQIIFTESSAEDHEPRAPPRKRAGTWVSEESRWLITFRRELDELFNTSKSNKHLWEQISAKMSEKGFRRSAAMCMDKWRNLLKEFKKATHRDRVEGFSAKISYYDEVEEFYRGRKRAARQKNGAPSRIDPFIQFSDKGIDDANIPFGPVEDTGRSTLNLVMGLDHDGHPLGICEAEAIAANGVPHWNWRGTPGSGGEDDESAYSGRVISVKYGECTKRIGIDGSSEAIKEAIKSAFGLRTRRAFWVEDENEIVRSLDRDMPVGNYNLCLDKGLTIKIRLYDDPIHLPVQAEEKTFYCDDDYRDFLSHRGWMGLKDLNCNRNVETMDDLHPGEMYQGLIMLGN